MSGPDTPQIIDPQQVRHIARLARLNLSDEEVRLFSHQLADILEYVRQIAAVDTHNVEPLAHPLALTLDVRRSDQPGLRDDEPQPTFDTETALANAPERHGPLFRVPAVLDPSAGA